MTTSMGPPPPLRNPKNAPEPDPFSQKEDSSSASMDPPPPKIPNPSNSEATMEQPGNQEAATDDSIAIDEKKSVIVQAVKQFSVPYSIPEWSGPPRHQFQLEVLKEGSIVGKFDVNEKGAYMFGRADICDFVLEHPTISRFHAVIQYKRGGDAYLFDLGSVHGTFVNKNQVDKRVYVDLHVGDVIRFGGSTRLYIFQGPFELMPPEKDLKLIREAKFKQQMYDRDASLRRAREHASMADGISWGMGEDAIEEEEEDVDEITWQTYKGQLTQKQEKTKEKVVKRMEKISHMKKEIAAIRAKDIAQGGLTQGQQTQIARNEQRIAQLLEELENLEETLNDSIRESLGAKSGKKTHGKKKGTLEDDENLSSDEDEFYDRTKKKPSAQKGSEGQTVETVDSLLDKRDNVMKAIEEKKELIVVEKNRMEKEKTVSEAEPGDSLDAYMTGLSSQLVQDTTVRLQQELSTLQSELDRILFLLKIADPTGEAVKKRDLKPQEPKPNKSEKPMRTSPTEQKNSVPTKPVDVSEDKEEEVANVLVDSKSKLDVEKKIEGETAEGKTAMYIPRKHQWLGAVLDREAKEEIKHEIETVSTDGGGDEFVDYKDRNKILPDAEDRTTMGSGVENTATGLIIRKRKQENKDEEDVKSEEKQAELMAQDAIALLLKHSGGYQVEEDETANRSEEKQGGRRGKKKKKEKKENKVLGPEKPTFLDDNTSYDSWVPPEGQSGDGRTSLNDRFGY
ncbi:PREDICTED: kanadaptin [Tarenaya hassleriana]|uniref:kanadaptin n=1 Tax=Tarenaya hassleriana TaxID=28532 RepID=UPI00053C5103|nr:PREDICTED: kanadaptin [Tarenaya hassleriana]